MPNQQNPENLHNRRVHAWPILFALLALEGLFILVEMVSIPADPKNALILGFSLRRLAVMFGVLLLAGAFSYFALRSWRDVLWRQKYLDPSNNPWLIPSLSRLSLFVLILCQALLFFTPYLWGENYTLRALYELSLIHI